VSYSMLRDLKKNNEKINKKEFHQFLIVGSDPFSLKMFYQLHLKNPGQVKIISPLPISENNLQPLGPNSLRGEENIQVVSRLFPEILGTSESPVPSFLKDQKFRAFGGRSKSETLLHGEAFFTQTPHPYNQTQVFPYLSNPEFLQLVNQHRLACGIKNIAKIAAIDLVERSQWQIECFNGSDLECEHLVWGLSPYVFLQQFSAKEELSNEFIEFCEKTHAPASLEVKMWFKHPITDMENTLFFPLSYTHEWGHFVGEFSHVENSEQLASFVTFLEKEHTSEEHVSKIIHIFKKNLEKIFPQFSANFSREHIVLDEDTPCLKIDDSLFASTAGSVEGLHFVGCNGPLAFPLVEGDSCEDSCESVSFLARGIINAAQTLEQLCL